MFRKSPFQLQLECRHTCTIDNDKVFLNMDIDIHDAEIHSLRKLQKEYEAIAAKYDSPGKDPAIIHHFLVTVSGKIHGRDVRLKFASLEALHDFVTQETASAQHEQEVKPAYQFFSPF